MTKENFIGTKLYENAKGSLIMQTRAGNLYEIVPLVNITPLADLKPVAKSTKRKYKRRVKRRLWTIGEENKARNLLRAGLSFKQIGKELNRSTSGVYNHLNYRMKITNGVK